MMGEKLKDNNLFAVCVTFLVVISYLGNILQVSIVTSISFYLSFILVFGYYLINDLIFKKRISNKILLLFFLMLFSAIINMELNLNYFKRFIIVFSVFICFEIISNDYLKIGLNTKRLIVLIAAILAVFTTIMYYFGGLNKSYHGSTLLICLNFSNPNEAGMWLTAFFVLVANGISCFEKKIVKLLLLIIGIGLFPILQATGSRNSILACVFFLVVSVFVWVFKLKKLPNLLIFVITILPVIVFFFYMLVLQPNIDYFNNLFSTIVSIGDKGISSRATIWQIVMDDFGRCFLFGDYATYCSEQMHNSIMTLYTMFGFFSTCLMIDILYKSLKKANKNSVFLAVSLSSLLFTGCFEASLFVGVAGLYLFVILISVSNHD